MSSIYAGRPHNVTMFSARIEAVSPAVSSDGGVPVRTHFPAILQSLSSQLAVENDPRCLDQIVGAVCRLIIAYREGVPIQQVLPVVFANLPLREDLEEYEPVLRAVLVLYADGTDLVKEAMPTLLKVCATIYDKKVAQDEDVFAADEVLMTKVRPLIASLVKQYHAQFLPQFTEVLSGLQSNNQLDLVTTLERIVASSD